MDKFASRIGKPINGIGTVSLQRLKAYRWPGNIRELENVIERAIILADGPTVEIDPAMLSMGASSASPNDGATLEAIERQHILSVLNQTDWVIEGPNGAGLVLDVHPNTLRSRMKKLGIRRGE